MEIFNIICGSIGCYLVSACWDRCGITGVSVSFRYRYVVKTNYRSGIIDMEAIERFSLVVLG